MSRCMSEGRALYRIHDKEPQRGCFPVDNFLEADQWNLQGWGIFWTVNRFEGPRRKENCREVIAWAVDLDDGTKTQQLERIKGGPLVPSYVAETARGHHLYFDAIDGDVETYREIVERLVDFYRGDKNAKDLCRILRVPAYLHQKGDKPFGVKCIFSSESRYTESEMRKAFPAEEVVEKVFEQKGQLRTALRGLGEGSLWEKVWALDCEDALARLSGSSAVNGERFSFRRNANGNLNLLVNDKSTSCWVDSSKRIGSHDKGGPTIFQWLNWYQRDAKRTVQIMREYFPEVFA